MHDALLDEGDVIAIATDLKKRGYRDALAVQRAVTEPDRRLLAPLPQVRRKLDIGWLDVRSPLPLIIR